MVSASPAVKGILPEEHNDLWIKDGPICASIAGVINVMGPSDGNSAVEQLVPA